MKPTIRKFNIRFWHQGSEETREKDGEYFDKEVSGYVMGDFGCFCEDYPQNILEGDEYGYYNVTHIPSGSNIAKLNFRSIAEQMVFVLAELAPNTPKEKLMGYAKTEDGIRLVTIINALKKADEFARAQHYRELLDDETYKFMADAVGF